jgi:glutamine amidotransferase
MIGVVSYGVGNVGSIFSMLRKIGAPARPVSTPEELSLVDKIILPGVGAFDRGMSLLVEHGLDAALKERVDNGAQLLGICLGMQLLGRGSEEGQLPGLGLIDAQCVRFRSDGQGSLKVPHMGWNELNVRRPSPLFAHLDDAPRFYYVHSYHLVCAESADILATTTYGLEFTAAVQRENVWGAQFHPEKSHRFGMTLLRNFSCL